MSFDPITAALDVASKIIDKIWPNAEDAAKAKLEMIKLQQAGEFKQIEMDYQLAIEQIKVNAVEAASGSLFIGGWRPAVGWVCVVGLAYTFIIQPLMAWGALLYGKPVPPSLDTVVLMELLLGMLGLAGIRSYDKAKGTAAK